MPHTVIDTAYLAHAAEPDNERLHHRFLERIADGELFVVLEEEAAETSFRPRILDLSPGRFVPVFDRDARMAEFLNQPAPYLAVSGRRLVRLLAGRGLGLALNPGVAPSSTLLPSGVVDWLVENIGTAADRVVERPERVSGPAAVDPDLLAALDLKLAAMAQLIGEAHLIEVGYPGDVNRLTLALVDVRGEAQEHVTSALAETARFSGAANDGLDVMYLRNGDVALERISAVSIRFELPRPAATRTAAVKPPGMDPDKPPLLK